VDKSVFLAHFASFFSGFGELSLSAENNISSGIAGRYATALFDLALQAKQIETVESDLAVIKEMMNESADLAWLVRSPLISRDDQAKAMAAVLEKLGVSDLVRRFVGTVALNRRLFAISDMIDSFGALLAAHRGEVVANVTSAKTLSKEQLDAVEAALKAAVGSDVAVNANVDESLIGGMIVKVGSRMVDSSIRTKLQNLKFAMKGVG
jgi:F-type H+-transporting ATPase subunit delta